MAEDIEAAVAALARRFGLGEAAAGQLQALVELVASEPRAPTAVKDPAEVIERHLADSLVVLEAGSLEPSVGELADIGSGAGFPGLPLAIARPTARVTLLESNARKCEFLGRAVEVCGLRHVTVVNARAEAWPAGLGRFDVVTARALAPLSVLAEYAAPLLRVGGRLVAWRGRRDPEAERAAGLAASELGMEVGEIVRVRPFPAARDHHLHLMSKVVETPSGFPRRPGLALKRPLGARTGV